MARLYGQRLQISVNGARAARLPRVAFALGIAASLGVPLPAAHAARLDYFALFGEWSVICAADEVAGERTCALEAPPLDPDRPRNAIELRQEEGGEPEIAVRRREMVNGATPVFLRIDAHAPHKATPAPSGEVLWSAAEAGKIIEELKKGDEMVLRTFIGSDNRPRDEFISLSGFGEAWEAYRLQRQQPVSGRKQAEK